MIMFYVTILRHKLRLTLASKYGSSPPELLECPSVIRNMRPLKRLHSGTIMGKFFVSEAELQRRVYPDLCFGWLYVITPRYWHISRACVLDVNISPESVSPWLRLLPSILPS